MEYAPVYRASTGPEITDYLQARAMGFLKSAPSRQDVLDFLHSKGAR